MIAVHAANDLQELGVHRPQRFGIVWRKWMYFHVIAQRLGDVSQARIIYRRWIGRPLEFPECRRYSRLVLYEHCKQPVGFARAQKPVYGGGQFVLGYSIRQHELKNRID